MKTVSLYPNPLRDRDGECLALAISSLLSHGWHVQVPAGTRLPAPWQEKVALVDEQTLFTQCDLIAPLGGDGTLLSVACRAAAAKKPLFGINLGKVGFMSSLEKEDLPRLGEILAGKLWSSPRMLLSASVNGVPRLTALNEIVLGSGRGMRLMDLSLSVNGEKLCDFRADGLIFNTPTGSTGYSFSAGGAVIDENLDVIGVKAISSFLLINAHPMIFSGDAVFCVEQVRCADEAVLCADGRDQWPLAEGDVIRIEKSPLQVELLFAEKQSNLQVFFRKF